MSDTTKKFNVSRRDDLYCLEGMINEFAALGTIKPTEKLVKLDLSGITYINSIGCKNWIQLLESLGDRMIEFHHVSTAMMTGISMLPGLLPPRGGRESIKSFYLPFFCIHCNTGHQSLVEPSSLEIIDESVFTGLVACPSCGSPMVVTEENSEFLYLFVYEIVDD